jgi:phage shock protein A
MNTKDILKKKLAELDQKVKARLAVHEMEPELKKMWEVRQKFKKVGQDIDEQMDLIERMKAKMDRQEQE